MWKAWRVTSNIEKKIDVANVNKWLMGVRWVWVAAGNFPRVTRKVSCGLRK